MKQCDHPARNDDAGKKVHIGGGMAVGARWCICEDAELGLKVFEHGFEATYLQRATEKA
jgi:hypothetical protein